VGLQARHVVSTFLGDGSLGAPEMLHQPLECDCTRLQKIAVFEQGSPASWARAAQSTTNVADVDPI